MKDTEDLYALVHPCHRPLDYLKLMLLTGGLVTVTCLASWTASNAVGTPVLLAPVLPTATFIALLTRTDLPAIPEGGKSRVFLTSVAAMLYAGGVLNASA